MLTVKNVNKQYRKSGSFLGAKHQTILSDISFTLQKGTCMGLVGESGSGKSTLSRLILGLEPPSSGEVLMDGQPVAIWKKNNPGQMSVVFQDYTTSVNPRFTVAQTIAEPLLAAKKFARSSPRNMKGSEQTVDLNKEIHNLLERVQLSSSFMTCYPYELSGGQIQRVCIARAIATRPQFILFDEALSSLDIPIQAQILDLLSELKQDLSLTYLFIAHDLMAVTALCEEILFLHRGKIVESTPTAELFMIKNSYAKQLLASATSFISGPVLMNS